MNGLAIISVFDEKILVLFTSTTVQEFVLLRLLQSGSTSHDRRTLMFTLFGALQMGRRGQHQLVLG